MAAYLCIRALPNPAHRDLDSGAEETDEEPDRGSGLLRSRGMLSIFNAMPGSQTLGQNVAGLVDVCDELLQG